MLKIHRTNTRGNMLKENLSVLVTDPRDLKRQHEDLFSELKRLCQENGGVGISANQVGLRANFFFVTKDAEFPVRSGKLYTAHLCVNPTWKPDPKSKLVKGHEGCLSLPGRDFIAERHASIIAEWTNALGGRQKAKLSGFAARVFQHEHDHLCGRLLTHHAEEIK